MMSAAMMAMTFVSCSDDDEPKTAPDEEFPEVVVDELGDLQNTLTTLNEDGGLKERIYGVVLDESTPNTISIGVNDFDEALEVFGSILPDTTAISEDGTKAQFSTRQGTAVLSKDEGKDGLIAHVDFDIDGLKYVDRINFLLHSAWPENAKYVSTYKLNSVYQDIGFTDLKEFERYICIKEYEDGQPAILVAISNRKWKLDYNEEGNGNIPNENMARKISKILQKDWNHFKTLYKVDGTEYLADNEKYWISKTKCAIFQYYRWTINLKREHIESHALVTFKAPNYYVLFYKPGAATIVTQ